LTVSPWTSIVERLQLVPDERARHALLRRLSRPTKGPVKPRVLAFANAHAFNLAFEHPSFAQALRAADVLLRDGSGLALLLRRCGRAPGLNMNGTDFIAQVLRACDGLPVAVLGTREPYLTQGLQRMQQELVPGSTVWGINGFAPIDVFLQLLCERRPAVVLLAMAPSSIFWQDEPGVHQCFSSAWGWSGSGAWLRSLRACFVATWWATPFFCGG